MNRILTGTALAVALIGSTAAYAATTPTTPTVVDYGTKCSSLASQWQTAETANATNPKLGKAKASAANAEKLCKSPKASLEKKGVANYNTALKLLGVTPT
jgi:hypothetical protein